MKKYLPRMIDQILENKLQGKGAVLIQGPKWCGKTTTEEQFAKSVLYMDEPDRKEQNIQLADISPATLLIGDTPRLIDEWQIAPKLWDAVRFTVDHREGKGQFILTGSSVPADLSETSHSGTGRFAWITMRNMSLYESGESTGEVSLNGLFSGEENISGINHLGLEDIAYLVCRGGWPDTLDLEKIIALEAGYDYLDGILNSDISRVDNVKRDPERAKRIMRSYARNQGSQITFTEIAKDVSTNELMFTDETVASYIKALKKMFVVEDMTAWNPNLRSKTSIRAADTRYFSDSAIAAAALGIGPNDLIADLKTFGLIFETMCIRDLRTYAERQNGNVYHYRDRSGLECDAVIHLRNGNYGLVEIKLGGDKLIREGAENLLKLEAMIDTEKMPAPSFKMILTGTDRYAYKRPDGVFVVPIGCLKD
ncbi:MAG: ATP-binding protein [Erysipelotrichaceae bacterium]|nr:ATP-binding protein [Erysipelotrichaceae bacterium]